MQCVEMGEPVQRTSEACFAIGSGELVRITRSDGLRFTYSDYAVWQGKNYPKATQIFENESQLADVHVSDVGLLKELKFPNRSAQSRVFGWRGATQSSEDIKQGGVQAIHWRPERLVLQVRWLSTVW